VRSPRSLTILVVACTVVLATVTSRAESVFEFAYPTQFGRVPAATYDDEGNHIGAADLLIEKQDDGRVRIFTLSGRDEGARTVASALFAPLARERSMRLVRQESRSFDGDGRELGLLELDHVAGIGSCTGPNGEAPVTLSLPTEDRVVNVPMNLLFLPLVRGEISSLQFQLFLCREGARLMDFEAWVAKDAEAAAAAQLIEVGYRPDFGSVVSLVARNFVPKLTFWFDRSKPHDWMGHRMPLYSGGPEVLVLRDGVPSHRLADGD
jgi:hypothetical protein